MTDPRNVQGSDADRAEGGLDVENAFAAFTPATDRRLGREAEAVAESVAEQNRRSPGGKGATFGRDEYAGS